jgi:hypothetical protein
VHYDHELPTADLCDGDHAGHCRIRRRSQQPIILAGFAGPRLDIGRGSAFERHADEVAVSPDQTTIVASAKFIEGQFEILRL